MPASNPLLEFQSSLQLPRYRAEDWFKFLESFFERCDADNVGFAMMDAGHIELVNALALMSSKYGMPIDRVAGLLQGIALIQFMHFTKQLKEVEPPLRMNIDRRDLEF
jgi:hypothetical protein